MGVVTIFILLLSIAIILHFEITDLIKKIRNKNIRNEKTKD